MVKKILVEDSVIPKLRMRQNMKKEFKLFFVLSVLAVGMFGVVGNMFLPKATATWVEGTIDRNTVWTLIDSPFIVTRNITIKSGALLTIEPGVEIRFGGDFWLIVEGILNATGTQERRITFTSN